MQNTLLSCVTSTNKEAGHNDTKHVVVMCDQHKQKGMAQRYKTHCCHVCLAQTQREGTAMQNTLLSCVTSTNKERGSNDTKHIVVMCDQQKQRGRAQGCKTRCCHV